MTEIQIIKEVILIDNRLSNIFEYLDSKSELTNDEKVLHEKINEILFLTMSIENECESYTNELVNETLN